MARPKPPEPLHAMMLRITPTQRQKLGLLAKQKGVSANEAIRQLIEAAQEGNYIRDKAS